MFVVDFQLLAKKVFTLYSLAVQQLSKQDHYDFGLRALTSLLRYAGRKRRQSPSIADEEVSLCGSFSHTEPCCCSPWVLTTLKKMQRPKHNTLTIEDLLYVCPQILLMAMKDMNIAKLTSADLPLFNGIIQDLFPAVETPVIDYGKVCTTDDL